MAEEPSKSGLAAYFCQALRRHLFTNPHSQHGVESDLPSSAAAESDARALTLAMCNASAEDYECIFTSGATGEVNAGLEEDATLF